MRRAVLLLVVAPALAHAGAEAELELDEATRAPAHEPAPPPEPPLPAPAFAPDPVAVHPAGLDPRTLCRFATACMPDPAIVASTAAVPLEAAGSVSGALLAYAHHPSRLRGSELAARVELWRGLGWSAALGYTLDAIDTTTATTRYHDVSLGGRLALPLARPAWVIGTAHVTSGDATGGNGAAGFAAAGARFGVLDLQLGLAGMTLDGDGGITASLRAGVATAALTGWLELDVQRTSVGTISAGHVGAAAGLGVRRGALTLDLEALVGDRAYSVLDNGEVVEALGDTFHTTGRAVVRYDLGPHLRPYLGASVRDGTTLTGTTSTDYTLVTAFAGLSLSF